MLAGMSVIRAGRANKGFALIWVIRAHFHRGKGVNRTHLGVAKLGLGNGMERA